VHHRLQALADGAESSQSQQVQRCGSQRCHHSGAITAVTVIVFPQLGVADPVPALQAPALSHQTQQRIWGGAQAGDEPVRGHERLAIAGAFGDHFHDPAGAVPIGLDVLRRFFRPQSPEDVTAMADLLIGCDERDVALS
jgi:hypothetical protein